MNLEHLKVIILIQVLFPQLIASALSIIIIIIIEKQEADKMKLTTCIWSRTHCSRDESTPLKRPGHLILAACINIKKGISETKITVYRKWELEFWGSLGFGTVPWGQRWNSLRNCRRVLHRSPRRTDPPFLTVGSSPPIITKSPLPLSLSPSLVCSEEEGEMVVSGSITRTFQSTGDAWHTG